MPRIAPEPAVEHLAAVPGLGSEALELIVADDLEAEPNREQQDAEAIDRSEGDGAVARTATSSGRATNHRIAPCSQKTVNKLRHQNARPCAARIA